MICGHRTGIVIATTAFECRWTGIIYVCADTSRPITGLETCERITLTKKKSLVIYHTSYNSEIADAKLKALETREKKKQLGKWSKD